MVAPALLFAAACELVTHAFDYQIAPAAVAGLCAACPAGADLRRPPCPVADPSPDLGRAFVFAARRSRLGHPADLGSLDIGLDLVCSTLPGGSRGSARPARPGAGPRSPTASTTPSSCGCSRPRTPPRPPAAPSDLDDYAVSDALDRGRYGVVVSIRGWNGLPDDPSVEVTVRSSPGLAAGALPAWAGVDVWLPYPDVDDDGVRRFALDRATGYVSGGTLVVDARALGASLFRLGPRDASFELLLGDLTFTGALTPGKLGHFTLSGVIDQPSAGSAVLALGASLAPCAGGTAGPFLASFTSRIALAPDMPFLPTPDRSAPCDGISFAWSLDAEPAILASEASDGGAGGGGGCP